MKNDRLSSVAARICTEKIEDIIETSFEIPQKLPAKPKHIFREAKQNGPRSSVERGVLSVQSYSSLFIVDEDGVPNSNGSTEKIYKMVLVLDRKSSPSLLSTKLYKAIIGGGYYNETSSTILAGSIIFTMYWRGGDGSHDEQRACLVGTCE